MCARWFPIVALSLKDALSVPLPIEPNSSRTADDPVETEISGPHISICRTLSLFQVVNPPGTPATAPDGVNMPAVGEVYSTVYCTLNVRSTELSTVGGNGFPLVRIASKFISRFLLRAMLRLRGFCRVFRCRGMIVLRD
jgi:hypothetical protein